MAALAALLPTAPPAPVLRRPRLPAFLRPVPRPPRRAAEPFGRAGEEPGLEDLLSDPLVHLVLARDGLTVAGVRAEMTAARHRLRNR